MLYDLPLSHGWWGDTAPTSSGTGWGPNGVIPFDQRRNTPAGAAPNTPAVTPSTTGPMLPDYSGIGNIIAQINAQGQQAQTAANNARIPMQPAMEGQSSQFISNLYGDANDPGRIFANVATNAAERAVAGGYQGSVFGGVNGLRLNELERIGRGQLAEQLHTNALARNPGYTPANPMPLLLQQSQQMYGAGQNQLNRDLQERIANAEMANRALQNRRNISAYNNRTGSYGPSLPTDYGRPGMGSGTIGGAYTNIPEDPNRYGPYRLPAAEPNIGGLENWNTFGTFRQDQYNQMLSQNPYFGLPDWQNPYSGDTYQAPAMQGSPYEWAPDSDFEPPRFESELMNYY